MHPNTLDAQICLAGLLVRRGESAAAKTIVAEIVAAEESLEFTGHPPLDPPLDPRLRQLLSESVEESYDIL